MHSHRKTLTIYARSYVDIAAFHVLDAAASQFPSAYAANVHRMPALAAFKSHVELLPRVAAYLKSDRRGYYEGNSMM
jgi:hypothetical protein